MDSGSCARSVVLGRFISSVEVWLKVILLVWSNPDDNDRNTVASGLRKSTGFQIDALRAIGVPGAWFRAVLKVKRHVQTVIFVPTLANVLVYRIGDVGSKHLLVSGSLEGHPSRPWNIALPFYVSKQARPGGCCHGPIPADANSNSLNRSCAEVRDVECWLSRRRPTWGKVTVTNRRKFLCS